MSPHPRSGQGFSSFAPYGVEMLCSAGCLEVMVGACKAGAWRQGRSEVEAEMWGWRTETTSPVFRRQIFFPTFIASSVQFYKQQGLSVLGDLLGSWSFISEQGAGEEAARLEGAAGGMLTLSHSPFLSLQRPLISTAEGWLPRRRQR